MKTATLKKRTQKRKLERITRLMQAHVGYSVMVSVPLEYVVGKAFQHYGQLQKSKLGYAVRSDHTGFRIVFDTKSICKACVSNDFHLEITLQ